MSYKKDFDALINLLKSVPVETKMQTIKTIKDMCKGVSLPQARSFVENVPSVIMTGLVYSEATRVKKVFTDIGVVADIDKDENENAIWQNDTPLSVQSNGQKEENTQTIGSQYYNTKCPTCGSTNVQKISGVKRLFSGLFGSSGDNAGKTMKCKSCGYEW